MKFVKLNSAKVQKQYGLNKHGLTKRQMGFGTGLARVVNKTVKPNNKFQKPRI